MVGHLLPSSKQPTNRLASNQTFAVPDDSYKQEISADPPGLELITVIASKTPLFSGLRNAEPAESYLKELSQALSKANVKPDVAATFHFIRTNPSPGQVANRPGLPDAGEPVYPR